MEQTVTLQFHIYNNPAFGHNRRELNVIKRENEKGVTKIYKDGEIRPDGRIARFKAWEDIPLEKAYNNIFGGAIKEYNASQKRQDRKIGNYLEKVNKNKQLNASYEVIIGLYEKENETLDEATKEKILKKYVDDFSQRNPNFVKIGAYLHDDENGKMHVHLDFIPIGHYEKGLSLRNSQTKALQEMGIVTDKTIPHDTLMSAWQRRERAYIQEIAKEYNLQIEATKKGNKHKEKNEYIIEEQEKHIEQLEKTIQEQEKNIAGYKEIKEQLSQKDIFGREKEYLKLDIGTATALYQAGLRQETFDEEVKRKDAHYEKLELIANNTLEQLEKKKNLQKNREENFDALVETTAKNLNQDFANICKMYGYRNVCHMIDAMIQEHKQEKNRDIYAR